MHKNSLFLSKVLIRSFFLTTTVCQVGKFSIIEREFLSLTKCPLESDIPGNKGRLDVRTTTLYRCKGLRWNNMPYKQNITQDVDEHFYRMTEIWPSYFDQRPKSHQSMHYNIVFNVKGRKWITYSGGIMHYWADIVADIFRIHILPAALVEIV